MSARSYGHDETDDYEALAEAERMDDGTISTRVVLIDKRAGDVEIGRQS